MSEKGHTFLWKLMQYENRGYDTFDACIVAADTEEEAKEISPSRSPSKFGPHSSWAYAPAEVFATKIGVCKPELKGQVILSSFNAG